METDSRSMGRGMRGVMLWPAMLPILLVAGCATVQQPETPPSTEHEPQKAATQPAEAAPAQKPEAVAPQQPVTPSPPVETLPKKPKRAIEED